MLQQTWETRCRRIPEFWHWSFSLLSHGGSNASITDESSQYMFGTFSQRACCIISADHTSPQVQRFCTEGILLPVIAIKLHLRGWLQAEAWCTGQSSEMMMIKMKIRIFHGNDTVASVRTLTGGSCCSSTQKFGGIFMF